MAHACQGKAELPGRRMLRMMKSTSFHRN
jgi:hypothetical protein